MNLYGDRVFLRPLALDDFESIYSWATDLSTTRYLGGFYSGKILAQDIWEVLENRVNGDAGGEEFAICSKTDLAYIGQCALMPIDRVCKKAEISFLLIPSARGQGLGLEALKLLIDFAFNQIDLNRLWLKCDANNFPAIKLYLKAGFKQEGLLRKDCISDGAYSDSIILGLLKEDVYDS